MEYFTVELTSTGHFMIFKEHVLIDTMFPVLIFRIFEFLKWIVVKFESTEITLKIEKQEKSLFKLQRNTSTDPGLGIMPS